MSNMQKIKLILKWIYDNHILSLIGLILLGVDVLTGHKATEINLLLPGGGLPIIATETAKAIAEGKRMYCIMFWGLALSLFDNVIRMPKISNWIEKL